MNLYASLLPKTICPNIKKDEESRYPNHLTDKEIQSKFGNYFRNNLFKNK